MPNAPRSHSQRQQERMRILGRRNDVRPSASKRGYDATWRRLRCLQLARQPVCEVCGMPATVVDHRIPLRAGGERLDEANLQSLCERCHNRKTATTDGGYGHRA